MLYRAVLIPALLAALCGCMGTLVGVSSLNQVTTTRTADGRTTVQKTPIQPAAGESRESLDKTAGVFEYLFNSDLPETLTGQPELLVQSADLTTEAVQGGGERRARVPLSVAASYARTRVWSGLHTSFKSASLPSIDWKNSPKIGGEGFEGSLLFYGVPRGKKDEPIYGEGAVNYGAFSGRYTANRFESGGIFVAERVRTRGGWLDAALRVYLKRPVFLSLSAGLFYYSVHTAVDTNAPAYTYSGLEGGLLFGTLGLGAGLRTPWDFPLQAFVEGTVRFTAGHDDSPLNTIVGQLKSGLALKF